MTDPRPSVDAPARTTVPDLETVRRLPKVLLHDHLDGGLRPATVLDLADDVGHQLPTRDHDELTRWFVQGGGPDADLVRYLKAFDHTVALLQTREALVRVAAECAEDLAADGVVHAEVRYAPELSTDGDLDVDAAIAAITEGFAAAPPGIQVDLLVCAMRQHDRSEEVFAAAARARERGVVGVDLAGPEAGYPAHRHAAALAAARDAGLSVTLHAGEADGPRSVADALDQGAVRLGHGVRIVEDVDADGRPGSAAQRVLDGGVTLELCPTSNVQTGVVDDLADHPLPRLHDLGFAITLNTDNRLMSGVSVSGEIARAAEVFGLDLAAIETLTLTAADAVFRDHDTRRRLSARISEGFAAARGGSVASDGR